MKEFALVISMWGHRCRVAVHREPIYIDRDNIPRVLRSITRRDETS